MIKIHPEVECVLHCPSDGSLAKIVGIAIPGMRCLADLVCPTCGKRYYVDLPVGQALWCPNAVDQENGNVYDQLGTSWFSSLLRDSFLDPDNSEIVPIVHRFFDVDRIIILNCLDFLYGHSLLKLLNAQRYLNKLPNLGCCVLVPSQLVHLVPEGVAEIWEFPVPIKDGWKWYKSLDHWIHEQIKRRKECFLSPAYSHPSNRIYNLSRFVRNLPDLSEQIANYEPIILFSYREDRLWGKDLVHQQRNIQKLYERLGHVFPSLAFVLAGFGKQNQLYPTQGKLIDLRVDKFTVEDDRLWLAYMKAADCAIGVHGSNMLLPSGLAKSTVNLVPTSRLGNIYQDILFPHQLSDIRDAFLKYRFIYGNCSLSDVTTSLVAEVTISILQYRERCSYWFKLGEVEPDKVEFQLSDFKLYETGKSYEKITYELSFFKRILKKSKNKIRVLLREGLHQLDLLDE